MNYKSVSIFLLITLLTGIGFSPSLRADIRYDIKVEGKNISGTRTIAGKKESFNFETRDAGGLIFITPGIIAVHVGDKETMAKHPLSYADAKPTQIHITIPKKHFLFSSFKSVDGKLAARDVAQFFIGIAKEELWQKSQFDFMGTSFELVTPKKNANIDAKYWQSSLQLVWKSFVEKFGTPTDHLVFVDLEGPISGGPLGENVLGMFATDKMTPEIQAEMKANLGWEAKSSTKAYVEAYYPKSKNPWEEYLLGTFSHEIGHLFFGFGVTREKVSHTDELWFSLGLGMIYDMEVTQKLTGRPPQLEVDIIASWKNNYAKLHGIDQKLINPDRTHDGKYAFDRTKVFAHGKAAYFLSQLREKIGIKDFDVAVKEYIKKCRTCSGGYQDFKKSLTGFHKQILEMESLYQVGSF